MELRQLPYRYIYFGTKKNFASNPYARQEKRPKNKIYDYVLNAIHGKETGLDTWGVFGPAFRLQGD